MTAVPPSGYSANSGPPSLPLAVERGGSSPIVSIPVIIYSILSIFKYTIHITSICCQTNYLQVHVNTWLLTLILYQTYFLLQIINVDGLYVSNLEVRCNIRFFCGACSIVIFFLFTACCSTIINSVILNSIGSLRLPYLKLILIGRGTSATPFFQRANQRASIHERCSR